MDPTPVATTEAPNEPVPGIPRRSTAEILDRLAQTEINETTRSRWYEPGKDFLVYSAAQDAVRLSEAGLKKLKLGPEEREVLRKSDSIAVVQTRMQAVLEEYDRKSQQGTVMKQLSRFVNGFSDFAVKVSPIVELLRPQSPEYTVTYGLIMIVFKAVVDKKDKQASLSGFLESVSAKLPMIEFYNETYPTAAMKVTIANIYIQIIAFLEQAARYYCTGRIGKLVDAILQPMEDQFQTYLSRIDVQITRMNELSKIALAAQQADMQDVLNDAGKVIARLYRNFEETMATIGSSMRVLDLKMEKLQLDSEYITSFQAKSYVQTLRQSAFPHVVDADEELKNVVNHGFRLSPKDHWENNGVLGNLLEWSQAGRKSMFWVGGQSGNQDTWVTELSVDLIHALDSQDKPVVYVFCAGPPGAEVTPTMLLRRLILQVLELYPLLALHNPERINLRRLKKAESFEQLWQLWTFLAAQPKEIFVLVDRLDKCKPGNNLSIVKGVLPRFIKMLHDYSHVSMIVTSVTDPPPELQNTVQSVFVDTGKRPVERHRRDSH